MNRQFIRPFSAPTEVALLPNACSPNRRVCDDISALERAASGNRGIHPELLGYISDTDYLPQALIVLRRRA